MRERTRKLTVTAMMLAVAVALLYLASLMPTGRLALAAAASLGVAACVIECGLGWGLGCWIGAGLLGAFLVPDKGGAVIFIVFFGIYPVLKSLFERQKSRALEWVLKFLFFNLALGLCWLAWRLGFLTGQMLDVWLMVLLCLLGNLVFFVYDIAFSKLIGIYILRIASKRHRK